MAMAMAMMIQYSTKQVNPLFFFFSYMTLPHHKGNKKLGVSCMDSTSTVTCKLSKQKQLPIINRRSANYPPSKWDFNELHQQQQPSSLKNDEYAGRRHIERSKVLMEQVKMLLLQDDDELVMSQLELIDDLQRLGISYHFEDIIESILRRIYSDNAMAAEDKGLYETALGFRLLRQHQFQVPQEVFDSFKCEKGNFKADLVEDIKGLLYLYEASFLSTEKERTLELAREFTSQNLMKFLEEKEKRLVLDPEITALVQHALELPLHWRMLRLESRWFMEEIYEKSSGMNPTILELAKLDFNIVQATHQKDLKYASRWWKSTGFAEKMKFARDRLVENFFWTVGVIFNPEYGYCRRMSTKVNVLITTIDDIYDVYGTSDELELFTDAVERWDVKSVEQLPDYMKMCYLALFNSINEMAYDVLKEQGFNIIPYLSKAWAEICGAYLKEARWYFNGYTPTLQEYLNNAWISISAPVILVHAYFFVVITNPINKEVSLLSDYRYRNIIRCSAMILRLSNDLGTSSDELKRGDVPKSIQCYMKETGASEEEARRYIRMLIGETWKEMNGESGIIIRESTSSSLSRRFVEIAMNLGRMAQCMYQNGDGHGHQDSITRERILALLFHPLHLPKI